MDDCKLTNKAKVWYSDDFFLTTPNNGELVRKILFKQGNLFTFLLLDPSQFWNLSTNGNLANKKTLELLTVDGKAINISNFQLNKNGFIENPETYEVLEGTITDKVIVNKKDLDNPMQLWKKGCTNFEGYVMIEHSEEKMFLSVTTDAIDTDYSIVLIGLFKTLFHREQRNCPQMWVLLSKKKVNQIHSGNYTHST